MNYLADIPKEAVDYGINKVLTVRYLSIDWKHRETEINLRTPTLVDDVEELLSFREIARIRTQQLRKIYHITRSIFKSVDPKNITAVNLCRDFTKVREYCEEIFIDIRFIIENKDGQRIYGMLRRSRYAKITVFDSVGNLDELNMIKYFIARGLPIADRFRVIEHTEIVETLKSDLTLVIFQEGSFTNQQQKLLWILNAFLYIGYNDGPLMPVTHKTDNVITGEMV